jgi:quercetin dioxygenase-like cupin family protein
MKSTQLLEHLEFHDANPYAEPLYVDEANRVIRFTLKAGQSIVEHNVPHSPFDVIVLQGRGMFAGSDGKEQPFGPNTLLVFEPGENHAIRALDEPLVFVGFLHGAPHAQEGHPAGGKMSKDSG